MNTTGAINALYDYEFPVVGKNLTINVFKNPAGLKYKYISIIIISLGEKFHVVGAKTAHLKFHGQVSDIFLV